MFIRLITLALIVGGVSFVVVAEPAPPELDDTAAAALFGGTPIYYVCEATDTLNPNWV